MDDVMQVVLKFVKNGKFFFLITIIEKHSECA